jgi:hypothetical protein
VIFNSFYSGFYGGGYRSKDFMDGMWKHVNGGNGAWTVLTPDGTFLAYDVKKGWAKWQQLPKAERKPGAFPVKKVVGRPKCAPPGPAPGTLVVRISMRNLKRTPQGELVRLTAENTRDWVQKQWWWPWCNHPFADTMWLTQEEWHSLTPAHARKGQRFPLPPAVKRRLVLWHLVNRTFDTGIQWEEKALHSDNLTLLVEEAAPVLRMRLEGSVVLSDGTAEVRKDGHWTAHGYEPRLLGFIDYDPVRKALVRFDVVALGDCWGGDYQGGRCSQVGRLPLAISFELAGNTPRDQVLPVGGVGERFQRYLSLK